MRSALLRSRDHWLMLARLALAAGRPFRAAAYVAEARAAHRRAMREPAR